MDALSNPRPIDPVVTRLRPGDGALSLDASSCVPPEAPLAMPTQSLTRFNRAERHKILTATGFLAVGWRGFSCSAAVWP